MPNPTILPLWPEGQVPHLPAGAPKEDTPTLTVYVPPKPGGLCCVVCPGGGYGTRAAHEAEPVAKWLNTLGAIGAVLAYRHAPRYRHPVPLTDALQAVRVLKSRAGEFGGDPTKVGILGFSAGGHLAASASTRFSSPDERPDFSILIYPVITLEGAAAHVGSRENLLGKSPDPALVKSLCLQTQVSKNTPPTFLVHGASDGPVPVANSLLYAAALAEKGVAFGMKIVAHGQHGFGMGDVRQPETVTWPAECAAWLKSVVATPAAR